MKDISALDVMFPAAWVWLAVMLIAFVPAALYAFKSSMGKYEIKKRFVGREIAAIVFFLIAQLGSLATLACLGYMICTVTTQGNYCKLISYPAIDDYRLFDANIFMIFTAFIGFCCLRNPPRDILWYGLGAVLTPIAGCICLSYIT